MPIKQRQVVVVHRFLDTTEQSFTYNLNLDFVPTSVIVKTITYGKNASSGENYTNGIIYPWSNGRVSSIFIDDNNGSFCSNPGTIFDLKKSGGLLINGDVRFTIKELADTQTPHDVAGLIGITLEFLQEEYPEPSPLVNEMKQLINVLSNVNKPRDVYPFDNIDRTQSQPAPVEAPKPVNEPEEMEGEGEDTSQDKKKNNPLTEM